MNKEFIQDGITNKVTRVEDSDKLSIDAFDLHYKNKFGIVAGYLPRDSKHIGKWLSNLVKLANEAWQKDSQVCYEPSVQAMKDMLKLP
ncbi:hypothetical protein [Spartinivicinus poritis]|uniref:Uncharacterized protein n=1 Tax=Spartinivicinus poritis TaxID=2994640 RepID=A0ABT5U7R2_9GAMM|nr:hypothetical protein [Spartinivicinus sp. A2-2]MDE1462031.1 hypothetical protein [Spartinivicinus sp. A2-2]